MSTDTTTDTPRRSKKAAAAPMVDVTPMPPHPLAHKIPAEWYGEEYVGRKVGGVDDLDVLDKAFNLRQNVLIEGPTGSAKTSLVYAWAAKKGLPVVNINCNGAADPRSLIGGWVSQPDGSLAFVRGDLYLAVQYGGVGYWDEINFLPPRIAAGSHGLFDKRRELTALDAAGSQHPTSIIAHKDFINIATYNGGYVDTYDLNEAFKNRFAFKLKWGYDRTVEGEIVNSITLINFAGDLRKRVEDGTLRTPISTNMLIEFESFYAEPGLGLGFAVEMFLNAFHDDERPIVQEAMRAYVQQINDDLADVDFEDA